MAGIQLIVLIPTIGRETLFSRALPSVLAQKRQPDKIIISVDVKSDPSLSAALLAEKFNQLPNSSSIETPPMIWIENVRTPGLSGTLNSGIYYIIQHQLQRGWIDTETTYLAFLDDDDAWTIDHLSTLVEALPTPVTAPHLVINGILRFDQAEDAPPHAQSIPALPLTVDQFLIGNPHIQGSNLFCALKVLALAGYFDEALSSCTDRDLMIRILDLGADQVVIRTTQFHTVYHFALSDPHSVRLSEPGSPMKINGLNQFWKKWHHRMTSKVKHEMITRASRLFQWQPPDLSSPSFAITSNDSFSQVEEVNQDVSGHWLLVGVVARSESSQCANLLGDLFALSTSPSGPKGLDVILLENGPRDATNPALQTTVDSIRAQGLRVSLISIEQQRSDCHQSLFPGISPESAPDVCFQAPISVTRSILQRYLAMFADNIIQRSHGACNHPVVAIFDDDKRIPEPLSFMRQVLHTAFHSPALNLSKRPQPRAAAVFCSDKGAPPLPLAATVRTSVLDLLFNTRAILLAESIGNDPFSTAEILNQTQFQIWPEAYYDLSKRHHAHLETPFWLEKPDGQVWSEILSRTDGILRGIPFCREQIASPSSADQLSEQRGGCTFIFDPRLLEIPNTAAQFGQYPARRSDMVWASLARSHLDAVCLLSSRLQVVHDRHSALPSRLPDPQALERQLIADILGAAAFQSLNQRPHISFRAFFESRLVEFLAGVYRIAGICISLEALLSNSTEKAMQSTLMTKVSLIARVFDIPFWEPSIRKHLEHGDQWDRVFQNWHDQIPYLLADYQRTRPALLQKTGDLFARHRKQNALSFFHRILPLEHLQFVGIGDEGVSVYAPSTTKIYKYLDLFKGRVTATQLAFLKAWISAQAQRPDSVSAICSPTQLMCEPTGWYLVKSYVAGFSPLVHTYSLGPHLLQFVLDCRAAGLCCKNVSPDNFVWVTDTQTLKFVDFGLDTVPWSAALERSMCFRVFLLWRWSHREDFRLLLRKSSDLVAMDDLLEVEQHLPELAGVQYFMQALNEQPFSQRLLPFLAQHFTGPFFFFEKGETIQHAPSGMHHDVVCFIKDFHLAVARFPNATLLVIHDDMTRWQQLTRRTVLAAGYGVDKVRPFHGIDTERFEPTVTHVIFRCRPDPLRVATPMTARGCVLLIQTCAQEWRDIRQNVVHLVSTLERGDAFVRRILVVDGAKTHGFLRQYCASDLPRLRTEIAWLQQHEIIDEALWTDDDPSAWARCGLRWFSRPLPQAHAQNGATLHSVLQSFEYARQFGTTILRLDSDVMISTGSSHSSFWPVHCFFTAHPDAIALSFNIFTGLASPPLASVGPFRIESRASFFRLDRLEALLPLKIASSVWPEDPAAVPLQGWHRLLDAGLKPTPAAPLSYRNAPLPMCFVHPPNSLKADFAQYGFIVDAVEQGCLPLDQTGRVDALTDPRRWWKSRNQVHAHVVFICCGRDVRMSRALRCLHSMAQQRAPKNDTTPTWQAICIDDASSDVLASEMLGLVCATDDRIVLIRRRHRVGTLQNTVEAIRGLCANPQTILVTLDLDDALIGGDVLQYILAQYAQHGVEMTAGGCLPMHKSSASLPYPVCFEEPRRQRAGGFVWSHLRTFQKRLFDRLCEEALKNGSGEYYEEANDWAFMLPMAEMAWKAKAVTDRCLYLYEPSWWHGPGTPPRSQQCLDRREAVIGRILAQTPYVRRRPRIAVVGDASFRRLSDSERQLRYATAWQVGHDLVRAGYVVVTGGMSGVMMAAAKGGRHAAAEMQARESRVVGILPAHDDDASNPYSETVVPTGLDAARNSVVALSDALVIVGGGAGTLSEVALAWHFKKMILAMGATGGVAASLQGKPLDARSRFGQLSRFDHMVDQIFPIQSTAELLQLLDQYLASYLHAGNGTKITSQL